LRPSATEDRERPAALTAGLDRRRRVSIPDAIEAAREVLVVGA